MPSWRKLPITRLPFSLCQLCEWIRKVFCVVHGKVKKGLERTSEHTELHKLIDKTKRIVAIGSFAFLRACLLLRLLGDAVGEHPHGPLLVHRNALAPNPPQRRIDRRVVVVVVLRELGAMMMMEGGEEVS